LDQQENTARQEIISNITTGPPRPTGFQQVSFPLTQNAIDDINRLKSNQVNWVQLSLDDKFTTLSSVTSKQINGTDFVSSIDQTKPQFYLYNWETNVTLIYYYPESSGTSIKSRMVYSTCKASLADQIITMGFPTVKKFDARSVEDLNINNFRAEATRDASSKFRPTANMLHSQNQSDAPEDRTSNPRSRFLNNNPGYGSAFRILTAGRGGTLPKGVVLPPPGAYGAY